VLDPESERGCPLDSDGWDGYPACRERILRVLDGQRLDGVVVLTGDAHSSWANDVASDPFDRRAYDPDTGRGRRAVELVTPGITSPGIGAPERARTLSEAYRRANPHVRFVDLHRRGYVLLDVTEERVVSPRHGSRAERRRDALGRVPRRAASQSARARRRGVH